MPAIHLTDGSGFQRFLGFSRFERFKAHSNFKDFFSLFEKDFHGFKDYFKDLKATEGETWI